MPQNRSYCEKHNDSWDCQVTWKFFSPIEKIKNGMQSLNYIKEMDLNLQNRDGVWIYADSNITIKGGDNDDNISIHDYPKGWSLNGIGLDTNASQFSCKSPLVPRSIWKFDNNGNWNIHTQDSALLPSIPRFDILPKNSGFWINCIE